MRMENVVIVGGGPTGLWLGAELAHAGVDVTILERRDQRDPVLKGFTIQPRTLELWASRGIVDRFLEKGKTVPNSHFALLDNRMDYGVLDTPFPYILILDQPQVETILEDYALAAGVKIRRGHTFTGLTQRPDSVVARVATSEQDYDLEAGYLVGCDGVRSQVREAAGIPFPGTESTAITWLADVRLDDPPEAAYYQKTAPVGSLSVVPLGPDLHRISGTDLSAEWAAEPTAAELAAKVESVAGTDFGLRESLWVSWTGTENRLAERYAVGRVFLAGDAAHRIYPAGGRGLNTGVQDAANLGWKLAAAVRHAAHDELLDSYHDERHAVGVDLIDSIRAQVPLMSQFSEEIMALRALLNTSIHEVPEFSRRLAAMTSGLDVVYRPRTADAHPLVGHRAPNMPFTNGTSLFGLLTPSRYLLLDLAGEGALNSLADEGPAQTRPMVHSSAPTQSREAWTSVRGALIRPDGHVAWASDETNRGAFLSAAQAALLTTRPVVN